MNDFIEYWYIYGLYFYVYLFFNFWPLKQTEFPDMSLEEHNKFAAKVHEEAGGESIRE